MLILQRSLPIPRIKIEKIINYVLHLCSINECTYDELKLKGLDFGKGKGDITRFLNRINIVETTDSKVKLTELGMKLCTLLRKSGFLRNYILHSIFKKYVPQYELVLSVIQELQEVVEDELYNKVNEKIKSISPSAWINKVAFKTIIGFLEDLEVIRRKGKLIKFIGYDKKIEEFKECIITKSIKIGNRYLINRNDLIECTLKYLEIDHVEIERFKEALHEIKSPKIGNEELFEIKPEMYMLKLLDNILKEFGL